MDCCKAPRSQRLRISPHAQQVVISAGQPHHSGVIVAHAAAQLEQVHVHVPQQQALFGRSHHAFNPEKTGDARAARHGRHLVHRRAGVQHQVASRQLHVALAVRLLNAQLAAFILVGIGQKQGAGNVAAHPLVG